MSELSFKETHSLEERKKEANKIRNRYPDRVPVIVEKAPRSNVPDIDKKKYLVPKDLPIGQFSFVIRKRMKLPPQKALFIHVNNNAQASPADLMSVIYDQYKDEDGFLYMTYQGENTFGCFEFFSGSNQRFSPSDSC